MSMSTFYVLLSPEGDRVIRVADSTSADEAVRIFKMYGEAGEMYASRMRDEVAADIRKLANEGKLHPAARMLKLYSHSLTKVSVVTL